MACVCNRDDCVLCEGRLFNGLASNQVCRVRGLIASVSYPARTMLFRERAPADRLFILKSGCVKLTTALADGREQILRLALPGQMFGFESLDESSYPYSACALTEANVCAVRHRDMMQILEKDPGVSLRMIRMLNGELERSRALIRDLGLKSSTERMASFILSLMPLQHGLAGDFALPLTRKEISEMLGLTVETVSRAMTGFQRAGIIRASRGRIHVLDTARLKALAEGTPPCAAVTWHDGAAPAESGVSAYDCKTGTG
ncbi:MAG: Crp/Fnr family transcriptional regulator [Sulfuricaulis sp.]|uniref:Crp/Fnr family transcriptional regulator n=1 Tax=Sulfuricaulis sp. TaxID=2003553 RepID=UPI0025FD0FCF|nr:Crp/Fnr family transcriptional regulator [Sulfuricaulis sp.]MCR4346639.1 Crp/Fnr family transcriptional regulator [Sulfuricaulis sp.]